MSCSGTILIPPLLIYAWRHWQHRRGGNLSHYQLVGYAMLILVGAGMVSGVLLTVQGLWWERMNYAWDFTHLFTGMATGAVLLIHVFMIWRRPVSAKQRDALLPARRRYLITSVLVPLLLGLGVVFASLNHDRTHVQAVSMPFPEAYSWRFGEDRPFAPSLARIDDEDWRGTTLDAVADVLTETERKRFDEGMTSTDHLMGLFERMEVATSDLSLTAEQQRQIVEVVAEATTALQENGAVPAQTLAGSETCGAAGCHQQIYQEWLPSAHRYSSMDDMFPNRATPDGGGDQLRTYALLCRLPRPHLAVLGCKRQ